MSVRDRILKLGRVRIVVIITLIAIAGASTISFFARKIFGLEYYSPLPIIIPSIVIPSVTWYIVGLLVTISELEKKARHLATHDVLTGVMTRRGFLTKAESLYNIGARNNTSLVSAYLDLDNFKAINDKHGHPGGDEVLKSFASNLENNSRKSDIVGRIGGEEFAMLLPETDLAGANKVLNDVLLASRNKLVSYQSNNIKYTVSIGIAQCQQEHYYGLEDLIKRADNALYNAKNDGKNRIVVSLPT